MERIVIPNRATYSPVSLSDVVVGAPFAARLLLGAAWPGQLVAAASAGIYAGSAARDLWARRGVRPIDFLATFGADVFDLKKMPLDQRRWEIQLLGSALNDGFVADRPDRAQVARDVDRHLTAYIAAITGQEVVTSAEIRDYTIARFLMPHALGACDPISGDVAIFRDMGLLEPHVIAHEFCHRKGYLKELHAQALAYLALRNSDDPVLIQAARMERLHRQITTVLRLEPGRYPKETLSWAGLRGELASVFREMCGRDDAKPSLMHQLYDKRMRLFGQNGLDDYDEGFTNFLWSLGRNTSSTLAEHARV
jgi:hypothetical protein